MCRTTPHHSPASAVVVTVMATAPGRGSSEGASPTASVTALLRVTSAYVYTYEFCKPEHDTGYPHKPHVQKLIDDCKAAITLNPSLQLVVVG